MRISNQMLNQTLAGNIQDNKSAVFEQTQRISSQKRILSASDDPAAWARAARLTESRNRLEQYERNASLLEAQLTSIDLGLKGLGDILQSASEIAVQGSDSSLSLQDRDALATRLDGLLESLLSTANSKYDGKYQFGGTQTDVPPFEATRNADGTIAAVAYVGANTTAMATIADGDSLPTQLVGGDPNNGVLMSSSSDPFSALVEMRDRLRNGENLADTALQEQVDNAYERVIVGRVSIGAYLEHIDFVAEVRTNQTGQIMSDLSDTEGLDLTQAATALSEKQTAYQAALAIATQTMRTSLIDYL